MALGYIGLANHNRVTLYAFDSGGVKPLPNLRGRRRTQEMGKWLLDLEPGGASAFADAMRSIALSRQGKGVMVILSDFMLKEGYEKGLRYLSGGGYDTFCLQVLSPEEIEKGKYALGEGITGNVVATGRADEREVEQPREARHAGAQDERDEDVLAHGQPCKRCGLAVAADRLEPEAEERAPEQEAEDHEQRDHPHALHRELARQVGVRQLGEEVVLAVRMLIGPLFRGDFALTQRRLGLSRTSYLSRLVIIFSERYRRASTVGE
jgi:uncharacterized protein (DUF58 family)